MVGPFEQGEADAQRQQEVKHVAADLQIALRALRHAQTRQMQLAPQPGTPILRRTQRAYPPAKKDTRQYDGRQHPVGHLFGVETIDNGYQKRHLYREANQLYLAFPFLGHGSIILAFPVLTTADFNISLKNRIRSENENVRVQIK